MDHNRDLFEGMVLFCAVVEQEGFTAAAKLLGHTPSHVSKEIQRLEGRLKTRLLNRTTRKISLTESGRLYYDNASRIVADARAAEDRLHHLGDRPFGVLRMSVPVVFAHGCLNAWLPEFLDSYPDISLEVDVSERRADIISEAMDLVVRIGALPVSDLIVRELFRTPGITVASPDYLATKSTPQHPDDLAQHTLIDFSFAGGAGHWNYLAPGGDQIKAPASPRVRCNDAETEKSLALAGAGVTRLPELACAQDIAAGRLVRILEAFERPPAPVSVLFASRDNLPTKTRAMIDFLVQKSRDMA